MNTENTIPELDIKTVVIGNHKITYRPLLACDAGLSIKLPKWVTDDDAIKIGIIPALNGMDVMDIIPLIDNKENGSIVSFPKAKQDKAESDTNYRASAKELKTFSFNGKALTVLSDKKGELWFIAREVCNALDIVNNKQAVDRLDDDEKLLYVLHTSGQNRNVLTINESGLYSLTLTSNKPEAKSFKKWITAEVLPSIRKTGGYQFSRKNPTPQTVFLRNHKAACLITPDKNKRLQYANQKTLEQTGIDILKDAGILTPLDNQALQAFLNKKIDDRTIQQLLDAVHYQHLDHTNARQILLGMFIKLDKGILYLARKCPLVDDHKAIQETQGAIINVPVYFKGHGTCRATVINLY